ncbi:MAG: hypothetical protein JJE27_08725, partial [Thermoleophilia bacterium]|nr:hypothetical protein [Thermoleophilia bacterium]
MPRLALRFKTILLKYRHGTVKKRDGGRFAGRQEFTITVRNRCQAVLYRNARRGKVSDVLAKATTYAIDGVQARRVTVEVDIRRGLPAFSVVGLPDAAVRESRERVRAALLNEGFEFPQQRITVNLAPADLQKAGPGFDLAIGGALLAASGQIDPAGLEDAALVGELSLDGGVRDIRGALAIGEMAMQDGVGVLAVPAANAVEAALVSGLKVAAIERLSGLAAMAAGDWT